MERSGTAPYDDLSMQAHARELWTLLKVSTSLASTMELAEVLQIAIESAADLLGMNSGAIYTLENEILYLGATTPPLPEHFPDELRLAHLSDHPHIQEAVRTRAHVTLHDARTEELTPAERVVVDSRQLVSLLYYPLLLKEEVTGVFIVGTTGEPHQFTEKELDLCNILSCQVSLAVANAQLYKKAQQAARELNRAYDATLEGWSRMLDLRDHTTDIHTQRAADLTVALAGRLGIPASEMDLIRKGALLHDIGKMGIPDAILQKPGRLSESEMAVMRTHPEKAYQILSRIDYLRPALDIPYCHHERWDGAGYPRGLRGEEIPLAARLFTVVDVFDALTSDRSYRPAWSRAEALEYLRSQAGKIFWPEAVRAFLEMVERGEVTESS